MSLGSPKGLTVSEAGVSRSGRRLVEGASVSVGSGEFVAVVGPNGAGKSSLLRLLAGLWRPEAGRATIDGTDLAQLEPRVRARRIAYLPQAGEIGWAITVRDAVGLGRLPYGTRPDEADRVAVERAMAALDIASLAARPVTELSGGERSRVLAARALAVEAPYLLADEPTLALDPRHQLAMMRLLAAEAERGVGVVAVLHDLTLAARFCTRVVLLAAGRVVADGPASQVLTEEPIAAAYGVRVVSFDHAGQTVIVPWEPGA